MIIKRKSQMSNPYHRLLSKSNHMCAVLDKNGNPLIFGSNHYNSNSEISIHAEIDALNKLINRLGRLRKKIIIDLVIIRTNGGNSFPCEKCMNRINQLNNKFCFRNIYFTNNNYDIDKIKFCNL